MSVTRASNDALELVGTAADSATFEGLGLSKTMCEAVGELGYGAPTPVQLQAVPAVLGGNDVLACAQTGSGKTAAFLLPTLDRLPPAKESEGPCMLVLVPTRELAYQVNEVAHAIGAHTGHRCAAVVGGVGYDSQVRSLARGCDVLVATPGRLLDLVGQGACGLGKVRVLVIDEADRMLDMGFVPSVRRIVTALARDRQTLLFSATLSPKVREGFDVFVREPVVVQVDQPGTATQLVDHYVLRVAPEEKKRVLVAVLRERGAQRVLVFVRGRHRADHLSNILRKKGFTSTPLHGGLSQTQRLRALGRFERGEVGVLVATDVLARGIHIPEVAYVVNADVPQEPKSYVHRIGRTGRAGKRGWALTLCAQNEYNSLCAIQGLMGITIPPYPYNI